MKSAGSRVLLLILILVLGAAFVYWMNHMFNTSAIMRDMFCGAGNPGVLGEVAPGSPNSLAMQNERFGRISMLIFSVITVMQFLAFGVAFVVIGGIKKGADSVKLKLKKLENADIFFDVPLYVGLFGTVSAFLVMTFSPQSSRLIAYSSTLIGIIFSLILRVVLLFPYRQKLLGCDNNSEAGK
ncbi:hypothetical protein [Victivallis vadensis]|uniref:Uncharacterized protein n=1 Tax=Victivallis vadensis TaxID=172901 RepID=A0A2U1B7K6_9BACT|nr:hypothetical protein [Victivallis vadensis]NMD86174.1 hypothetical protein [Victivallis vadensis]PVY44582.1 hypothetical protein C8D82_106100 [Victivallis vadensis]HJH04849.1 hypothetical protein [Victivallis vadensis]